ncbi:GNAT family N-acetyltransferase [Diaphorobacter sp. HDW4B]|uniref:GNAT family N-acetyltransferase n=1 Tax=Diaphorobacter sp. HDW4B TaxID=2714925 RepID=UPI0014098FEF|nr:GNAT family N-acetyltransferase [Diaphorobacter sp. HDW4B]QIL72983.1 GNAT family N-acetyltransferase [Diaphorobacter sp. HDW4B]
MRDIQSDDYPFLRNLFRDLRARELSVTDWPQAQKDGFCDSQFELQDRHYRSHYEHAHYFVIERDGAHGREAIGRIYVNADLEFVGLMEITILSHLRGQRIGSTLMHWLTSLADANGQSMRLFVEPDNPARNLYERNGFVAGEMQGPYLEMSRPAISRIAT